VDSELLVLKYGKTRRILDFHHLTITDIR
jgi:hypothetical protein